MITIWCHVCGFWRLVFRVQCEAVGWPSCCGQQMSLVERSPHGITTNATATTHTKGRSVSWLTSTH